MFSFTDCARYVIDRAHFAGNSWGGMIGGTFAALYPDRLNRAVLMNCTASKAGVAQKIRYAAMLWLAQSPRGSTSSWTRSCSADRHGSDQPSQAA